MQKLFLIIVILITAISAANGQEWHTDFEKAKQKAEEEEKTVLLVFQGSDWCAPCMKLEKEIWSSEEFKKYAEKNFSLVKADFPRKKANRLSKEQEKANGELAEQYNRNGFFPLVVLLDSNGIVLGQTGYKKLTPTEYIRLLEALIEKI